MSCVMSHESWIVLFTWGHLILVHALAASSGIWGIRRALTLALREAFFPSPQLLITASRVWHPLSAPCISRLTSDSTQVVLSSAQKVSGTLSDVPLTRRPATSTAETWGRSRSKKST